MKVDVNNVATSFSSHGPKWKLFERPWQILWGTTGILPVFFGFGEL
jgi:hypothetical protein